MTRAHLQARILAYMDGSLVGAPPEPFEALAAAVHAWQRERDPVIASFGDTPEDWRSLPAVPVGVYKALPVGTVKEEPPPVAFRTSGTTGSGRGVHRLRDTVLYDHGAAAWARRCVPDLPPTVAALLHDPSEAPDSSLSHMIGLFAPDDTTWHLIDGQVDVDGLSARLHGLDRPVFLAATAFALADVLAHGAAPLPSGSLVMVTGGFKGRTTDLDHEALYARAQETLRPRRVVTEYGMTELSSQLWGHPGAAYRPPPWLRVVAVDPERGTPLAHGVAGQLRFLDLANLDSSLGVETMDRGIVHGDGAVELLGRLVGAEARGCSLTVEEAWADRGGA